MIECMIVVGWFFIGVLNLCSKEKISKLSYFLVWSVAMTGLIYRFLM